MIGALAMAAAFPKANATILAPIGTLGLFWAWFGVSARRAFWIGCFAGTIYFAISYAWFGETVGAYIAPFGFLIVLLPALLDGALQFGLAGALVAYLTGAAGGPRSRARAFVPIGSAAIFSALEWFRAEAFGTFSIPFASVGDSLVGSPLAPLAAFVGGHGITFVVALIGAYAALALRERDSGAIRHALVAAASISLATLAAWAAWPARALPPPTVRVAAIQGDISQATKWTPRSVAVAVATYESLSRAAARARPALVVWPETVVATALDQDPALEARLAALARELDTTLVVGTLDVTPGAYYNALRVIAPSGATAAVYRKRRLVPFAERLPLRSLLGNLAWAREISNFAAGTSAVPFAVGALSVDPLICWESDFGGLVGEDARRGTSALAIATDDAWFGRTAGPYMHAQIAQMRALETGRYVVRAASTGISGIIAPDGRFTARVGLDTIGLAQGAIGAPAPAPFVAIGGRAIALLSVAIYAICIAASRRGYR